MANQPRTLDEVTLGVDQNQIRQLERTLGLVGKGGNQLRKLFKGGKKDLIDFVQNLDKVVTSLEEQKKLLEQLEKVRLTTNKKDKKIAEEMEKAYTKVNKQIQKEIELAEELVKLKQEQAELQKAQLKRTQDMGRIYDYTYRNIEAAVKKVVQQSEDLFKISHDLQIQGNMTWSQYTKLYNDSFEAIREMNMALGQSVFNTRQLFEAQQKLVPAGWKGIDTTQLTDLSQAVLQINATLGVFPEELSTAFQMSFRQFEAQTENFVYAIGNRLNAFSNSFGVTVGALTGAVTQMMAANSFLMRNNMSAQIAANESLMMAVALSSAVGIETSNFMVGLAKTTQFGTASQMSELYQTGALLQGFSTHDFQQQMRGGDYMGATQNLIKSIQTTLGGMDEGYLRNEYMQRISQGFGLSQDDILQIMASDNLDAKALEVQEKLLEANNSMEDELRGLKVSVMDRLNNWWDAQPISQGFGKVLQDFGLIGVNRQLDNIFYAIVGQNLQTYLKGRITGGGVPQVVNQAGQAVSADTIGAMTLLDENMKPIMMATPSVSGTGGGTTASGLSMGQRMGLGVGGLAVAGLTNYAGRQMSLSENRGTHIGGGFMNILGGATGGAMTGFALGGGPWGAAIGGLIGAAGGLVNTITAAEERRGKLADLEDQRRQQARQASGTLQESQDPILNALGGIDNKLGALLATTNEGVLTQRESLIQVSMVDKAKTK